MHVETQDGTQVTVILSADEAVWTLHSLRTLGADAGKEGTALAEALEAAGVKSPPRPDHERSEYMPPKD